MSLEQESNQEIIKRSPLVKSLLEFTPTDLFNKESPWNKTYIENLNHFMRTLSKDYDPDWQDKTFLPVYGTIDTIHPIFNLEDDVAKAILQLSLFGAGYEIGSAPSVKKVGDELLTIFDRYQILNTKLPGEAGQDETGHTSNRRLAILYSYRGMISMMAAGSHLKEKGLFPFISHFPDNF